MVSMEASGRDSTKASDDSGDFGAGASRGIASGSYLRAESEDEGSASTSSTDALLPKGNGSVQNSPELHSGAESAGKSKAECQLDLNGLLWMFVLKCGAKRLAKLEATLGQKVQMKSLSRFDPSDKFDLEKLPFSVTLSSEQVNEAEMRSLWTKFLSGALQKLRRVRITAAEAHLNSVQELRKKVQALMTKLEDPLFISLVDNQSVTVAGIGMIPSTLRNLLLGELPHFSDNSEDEHLETGEKPSVEKVVSAKAEVQDIAQSLDSIGRRPRLDSGGQSTSAQAGSSLGTSERDAMRSGKSVERKGDYVVEGETARYVDLSSSEASSSAAAKSINPEQPSHSASTKAKVESPPECSICKTAIGGSRRGSSDITTTPCSHSFHSTCLWQALQFGNGKCPVCRNSCNSTIAELSSRFGKKKKTGKASAANPFSISMPPVASTSPKSPVLFRAVGSRYDIVANPNLVEQLRNTRNMPQGKMEVRVEEELCVPGHSSDGCIVVLYSFPDATMGQQDEPNEPITAFLPAVPEAFRLVELLRVAFDERWTFFATGNRTSSRVPILAWGPLTHKTELFSDTELPTFYSYPDPNYLQRLQTELKLLGITSASAEARANESDDS